ncbi:caspase domain-containing protein [Cyathus striatus]|nr:caspase domain-containing protein [Cyathus striatus]
MAASFFSIVASTFPPVCVVWHKRCLSEPLGSSLIMKIPSRVFALVIGIDSYESGSIWNLHSCVDDAKAIKNWLMNSLNVPREQICLLLDSDATKQEIEDSFLEHLINNASIERGDAIFIYFAGHGSQMVAPISWHQHATGSSAKVDLLCTYDHDAKRGGSRVVGISDRSFFAMLSDLSRAKGDNITVILDCCFSPYNRDFKNVRWTRTTKASADDLTKGLWETARSQPHNSRVGFFGHRQFLHNFLFACGPGGAATEGKNGGVFTEIFLRIMMSQPVHNLTFSSLLEFVLENIDTPQRPIFMGPQQNRILFNAVPFVTDPRYIGEMQGIAIGSELTFHQHNFQCSHNPILVPAVVTERYPTYSLAQIQLRPLENVPPQRCWAKVVRWNNTPPFRVHLKTTFTSFFRTWRLRRLIPAKFEELAVKARFNICRVTSARKADISVTPGCSQLTIDRHDHLVSSHGRKTIKVKHRDAMEVIQDVAHHPLSQVSLELYLLDTQTWNRTGPDLFRNGQADIIYDRNATYAVVIRNSTNYNLWPYLVYMDPSCYGVTMLYSPDPGSRNPPLPSGARLDIGTGGPGEALTFDFTGNDDIDSGFIKLFVSTSPACMSVIEQGPSYKWLNKTPPPIYYRSRLNLWDTTIGCIKFFLSQRSETSYSMVPPSAFGDI